MCGEFVSGGVLLLDIGSVFAVQRLSDKRNVLLKK
jgi:hypothetical protein